MLRYLRQLLFRCVLAALAASLLSVVMLRFVTPPASAFMVQDRVTAWLHGDLRYRIRYDWIPLEHIAPDMALAVIAAEDQNFPNHDGFDFPAIRRALRANQHSRRLRGGSTISQQVAKNLFCYRQRSYLRKGLEAYFTVLIEVFWPKRRIIEMYLNVAEFGGGIYGVSAASYAFFGTSPRRLSTTQAAQLAAVLPNPKQLRANQPSRYVLARRNWILLHMRRLGGNAYLKGVLQ